MDFIGWTSSEEGEDRKAGMMVTVFWDTRDIIHIDYFPSKQTINDDYYAALLDRFNNILKKKRPHLAKKKVLFHQDNARIHTCPALMAKFNEFRYELLPHPDIRQILSPATISCFQIWRNDSEERDSPSESSSSPKQRLILKDWTNHIILTVWKSWTIIESSVSN